MAICSTVPVIAPGYCAAMRVLDERVESYIHGLRRVRSPVMAEMEAVAEREVKAKYDPDNAFHHNKNIQPG